MTLLALLLGLCIGSFLNVVVWRVPRGESVVWPGSHCPRCGTDLPWTNNIPVLSWVFLRGQCQFCHGPISVQYPLIELLSGGLWVLLAQPGVGRFGPLEPLPNLLAGGLLLSLLLPLALIDLRTMRLPEPLCRWGVISGLVLSAVAGWWLGLGTELLLWHAVAAVTGLLIFEAISGLGEKLLGAPALGLGDAKLAALLGAWLGLQGLAVACAVAVVLGAAFGLAGRLSGLLGPKQPFPFGPFLALGGLLSWLACDALWAVLINPGPMGL